MRIYETRARVVSTGMRADPGRSRGHDRRQGSTRSGASSHYRENGWSGPNPAETVAMRLNLRVAFLAAITWLNARPNKMQDHRHDRQEANAIPKHSQQPENEKLRGEWAGFQAAIREILSEEDHLAAQRKLGAAQLRIARGLNRITAIGAIVGLISSLGIIGSLL